MKLPTLAKYLYSIKRLPNPPKSFFPNITFTLIRTERRSPNQAVFRCPRFMNRYDIASYFGAIYAVKPLDVQTINYNARSKWDLNRPGGRTVQHPFKKAFLTLPTEFAYPPTLELERLSEGERKAVSVPLPGQPERLFTTTSLRFHAGKEVPLRRSISQRENSAERLRLSTTRELCQGKINPHYKKEEKIDHSKQYDRCATPLDQSDRVWSSLINLDGTVQEK